jgi:hypothetical protein
MRDDAHLLYPGDDTSFKGEIINSYIHQIEYGVPLGKDSRVPLVMIRLKLNPNVHERFLQYPMFSCDESELSTFKELDNRVKPPVYIYEGYFHSLPTNEAIFSRNPNPLIAIDFMKPAAGLSIRAFFEAFRSINKKIFDKISNELITSSYTYSREKPEQDICFILAKWIQNGYLFGDLSIQFHYGRGNEATFNRAWHSDAENSLFHLAVTIRGNRVLHSKRTNSSSSLVPVTSVKLEPLAPGDVYLSSSTLMLHAPKFSNCGYNDRVIAIHARILYTTEELQLFRKHHTLESWVRLTGILANNLASANIKVPTLAQIESFEKKLMAS